LISCRRGDEGRWRLDLVAVFLLVFAASLLPEAVLSPSSLLSPLHYELNRPLQMESLPGSLLWLAGNLPGVAGAVGRPHVAFAYFSLSLVGGAQRLWELPAISLGIAGVVIAYWRAWHDRDSLGRSFLLVLLAVLVSGKVFSPQYILWVLPLAAVVEGIRIRWLLVCGLVSLITYFYVTPLSTLPHNSLFLGTILLRNSLLYAIAVTYVLGRGDVGSVVRERGFGRRL